MPVLADRDHRRLGALVGEHRRQQADERAGRDDRDDRLAGEEQFAHPLAHIGEARHIGVHPLGETLDPAVACSRDATRQFHGVVGQNHDMRAAHEVASNAAMGQSAIQPSTPR